MDKKNNKPPQDYPKNHHENPKPIQTQLFEKKFFEKPKKTNSFNQNPNPF